MVYKPRKTGPISLGTETIICLIKYRNYLFNFNSLLPPLKCVSHVETKIKYLLGLFVFKQGRWLHGSYITIRMVEGGAFYCWRRRCRLRSGHIPERFFCTLLLSLFQIKDSDLNINLLKLITKKVVVPVECRSRKGGRQLAHGKGGRGRSIVDVSAADFGDYIIFQRYSFYI